MSAAEAVVPDDGLLRQMAESLGRQLRARGLRLAVAESCTGGWIAKVATDIPGSSDWFEAGLVTYSNHAKATLLGVPEAVLATQGAVSEPVVRAMAAGLRRITGVRVAAAVSGVAGPGGGTPEKPVGLVHLAFAVGERDWALSARFQGDREAVRRQTVALALRELEAELTR